MKYRKSYQITEETYDNLLKIKFHSERYFPSRPLKARPYLIPDSFYLIAEKWFSLQNIHNITYTITLIRGDEINKSTRFSEYYSKDMLVQRLFVRMYGFKNL